MPSAPTEPGFAERRAPGRAEPTIEGCRSGSEAIRGTDGGVGASKRFDAATTPLRTSAPVAIAEASIRASSSDRVSAGLLARSSPATPAVRGVANDVPHA